MISVSQRNPFLASYEQKPSLKNRWQDAYKIGDFLLRSKAAEMFP